MKKFSFWKKLRIILIMGICLWLVFNRPFNSQKMAAKNMLSSIEISSRYLVDTTKDIKQFLRLYDSLEKVKDWKRARLTAQPRAGGGNFIFQTISLKECTDCYKLILPSDSAYQFKYFIELPGFTLNSLSNFFIEKDKYYVTYGSMSHPYQRIQRDQNEKMKEISVRLAVNESNDGPPTSLLVPVSRSAYRFWNIAQYVITIPLLILSLFLCIYIPISTLYNIAQGKSFTKRNIWNLQFAGWSFILGPMLPIFAALIAKIVLINKLPNEIIYPYWQSIYEIRGWLIAGLVCLLFAEAFKSGYELKKEQELII